MVAAQTTRPVMYGLFAGAGLERHNLVLEDFGVRVGKTGIDEIGPFTFGGFDAAGLASRPPDLTQPLYVARLPQETQPAAAQ